MQHLLTTKLIFLLILLKKWDQMADMEQMGPYQTAEETIFLICLAQNVSQIQFLSIYITQIK